MSLFVSCYQSILSKQYWYEKYTLKHFIPSSKLQTSCVSDDILQNREARWEEDAEQIFKIA